MKEQEQKKVLDTTAYISVLKELVEAGEEVSLRISGNSMLPFLVHNRDDVFFRRPDSELKKGDIVFYRRDNGQYVMHRIYRVTLTGYDLIGDGQSFVECGIRRDQIFGRVTKVRRKGKILTEKNICWKFFQYGWIRMIPIRAKLVEMYTWLQKR